MRYCYGCHRQREEDHFTQRPDHAALITKSGNPPRARRGPRKERQARDASPAEPERPGQPTSKSEKAALLVGGLGLAGAIIYRLVQAIK